MTAASRYLQVAPEAELPHLRVVPPFRAVVLARIQRVVATRQCPGRDDHGLYKAELIHRRAPWKTKESLELATLEWVPRFNHHRLLEPIGYIPPAEAEANYYRHLAEQAAMSGLT